MPGIDDASQLPIQTGLVLSVLVLLASVGILAGLSTVSAAVDGLAAGRVRRFASQIARVAPLNLVTAALLEALAVLVLVLFRVRYAPFQQTGAYWAGVLVPLAGGLALLGLFRSALAVGRWPSGRPALGLTGVGLVVTACLVLVSGAGVLLKPESWPTIEPFYRFLPTWSGTGRFVELTLLSFGATGVGVAWAGERQPDAEVVRFARRLGSGLTLVTVLAWPLAILFSHYNLPAIALSAGVWGLAAAGILLAGATAGLAAARLAGSPRPLLRPLAASTVALLAILVVSDHLSREQAVQPATLAGVLVLPAAAPVPRPPAAPELSGQLAAGKAVFDRVCSLCHRFDVRLVGPPFNETIPKYRKDPEALKAFIRNPVKRNPGYPQMPKPAVTEPEIDAVAAYLLAKAAP